MSRSLAAFMMRLSGGVAVCGLFAFSLGIAGPGIAQARLIEERMRVPVKLAEIDGKDIEHTISVMVFHENTAPKPHPVLVLNHGRAGTPEERAALKSSDYAAAARWLAGLGFMVAVPIRVGYGVTGGADVEDSGACERKNYPAAFRAGATQTLQVLDALRQRTDVAKDRAIVMGQSFGGTTAITLASLGVPGVQAAINFAGGGGGRPKSHPHNPCSQAALLRMFADYGKTARIPTLWLYTENDLYWGPQLPGKWFSAFKAAGGTGEYVLFPPCCSDGHLLSSRAPQVWQPLVLEFLRPLGYKPVH